MDDKRAYIDDDGEVRELDTHFFKHAKRGRPAMPNGTQKQRVNLMLDPDVIEALKAKENMSGHVNAVLRNALGLPLTQ